MSEKDVLRLNRPIPPPLPPRAPSRQPPRPVSTQSSPTTSKSHQLPEPFQSPPADPPPPYESTTPYSTADALPSLYTSPYLTANGLPSLATNDPRTSSTQSLVPTRSNEETDRRRLLLIFIHGFMGNETSFQSFPAHVHNLVATLVADTHVVHTKLYPRYRSRKNITFARDDFGRWLEPHEGHATDVVLLGHSMGGLVSAEVALSQLSSDPHSRMRHRIVGTVNFDVPFLGMHPSVIKSGLASIFSPGPESPKPQPDAASASSTSLHAGTMSPQGGNASTAGHASRPPALPPRRTDTLFSPQQPDPNYNPSFENDVILPMRKGWMNAWHFVSKHNDDLIAATKQLVKSHMEFGGTMADYSGLKNRYCRIRALEESNPDVRRSIMGGTLSPPRVRFVNYYTSSTGRPKKPKSPLVSPCLTSPNGTAAESMTSLAASVQQPLTESPVPVVAEPAQIDAGQHPSTTENHAKDGEEEDEESVPYDLEESNDALRQMDNLEPLPMSDDERNSSDAELWTDAMEDLKLSDVPPPATDGFFPANSTVSKDSSSLVSPPSLPDASSANPSSPTLEPSLNTGPSSTNDSSLSLATNSSLPPIPEAPPKPTQPDFSVYIDKETRKIAEKDYSRIMKTYERAVRDRDRAIRDREKLEEKRKRAAIKQGKRAEQAEEKESKRMEKEREKDAKQKQKAQGDAHEKKFELQRRETEQEWKETLDMKWNAEDGTVVPMPQSSTASVGQVTHSHRPSLAPSTSLTTGTSLYSVQSGAEADARPRKERTFCTLPPKDASGNRDPVWVKVFMPDVDEVGAHCGLFFETSPAYEQLVGDVGEKVAEWVAENESDRIALRSSGGT